MKTKKDWTKWETHIKELNKIFAKSGVKITRGTKKTPDNVYEVKFFPKKPSTREEADK